ncbi:N-acetylmuramoyl-L-alanine amidase [Planococcus halocryophilus]|uniref:N-acetylmuramoyl-L-alanine amidase n=1 Tax=Planococcus halocryophilus TaxID=1215089 RepID=UPI001F1143C7|nr:N-acetylmuramoyl-L-alanine amidase [Planococcus halocryophilus]MCH4826835.1 N-acetylmuramoyl-L-alanine amidase [Planococcus halocryophilus]
MLAPMVQVDASGNFQDIGDSHRAAKEITYLTNKNIINGVSSTHFVPDREVTRGEAAAMIGRSLGLNGTKRNTSFKDVSAGNMASGYIMELVAKDVINGYGDGTFRPDVKLKRGEMAVLINRAYNLGGTNSSSAAKVLMDKGIAQGMSDGSFGTNITIIRSDFAVFLARTINADFRVQTGDTSIFKTTQYVNVGSSTLNMRSKPQIVNSPSNVISKLNHGQVVSVASYTGNWAYIKVNNLTGYVDKSYLSSSKPSAVLPAPPPAAGSDITVIIDPGHGDHDPGANGFGFQEKNVNLNIATHMKSYFDQTSIQTKMTRTGDAFLSLTERAQFAKKYNGDIFVSMHMNSFNHSANGQESYYYSTSATNPYVNQSKALSTYMLSRMQEAWPLVNRGVKKGNLAVLRENTVPATLVEMGFIDSEIDLKYFKSDTERKKMGRALFLATLDYYYHYEGRTDLAQYYSQVGASPSKRLH